MGACLKLESINALGCKESEMTTSDQIRILTVDNHPLLLEGLAAVIRSQPDMVLIGQASSCGDAIQKFRELQPHITLMDLRLPDMDGIDALSAIQTQFPEARIIVMTTFDGDGPVQRALEVGARSYIRKNMPPREIADAIRQVHAGKKRAPAEVAANLAEPLREEGLIDYEADVLRHTAGGNRNREIADKLFIARETGKAFTAESGSRGYSKSLLRPF
jgi:DNA-binding NarL/FixJ family response regulator